jgi:hypothetical protein
MNWPISCVDNFFDDPYKIVELSKKISFNKSTDGRWPGTRSPEIHKVNMNFFNFVTRKIMRLIYPMSYENATWKASSFFQKVKGTDYPNSGWVHHDGEYEFTTIIYLSHHENCGTSIWKPKYFGVEPKHTDKKHERFLNQNTMSDKIEKIYLNENNEQFKKTLTFDSVFNRFIMFDGSNFHSADNFTDTNQQEDRLTLITFFKEVQMPDIKYPIPTMKRLI